MLKEKKYILLNDDIALRTKLVIVPEELEMQDFTEDSPPTLWSRIFEQ